MKQYRNPQGILVGFSHNNTYFTERRHNHYYRKYLGFGLSESILKELEADGVTTVQITYLGKTCKKILLTTLQQWLSSQKRDTDLTQKNVIDKQVFVSEKDMTLLERP